MPGVDTTIGWTLAVVLAAVFVTSAALKLRDITAFRLAVEAYRIVPRPVAAALALAIPVVEITGAACVLFQSTREVGAVLLIALLAMFTAAIAINLARGRRDIDCGCFGPALRQNLSGWLVARNAVLAAFAAIVLLPGNAREIGAVDVMTIAGGAVSLLLLYAAVNYLLVQGSTVRIVEIQNG